MKTLQDYIDKLFAFQILDTAKFMDDVKHICHTLGRMINVTLKVYKSRSLLKNAIFISFCYIIHEFGGVENLKGKKLAMTWAYSPSYGKRHTEGLQE